MMLFLDTEYSATVDVGSRLVSLGLVGEDDRFVFYAERDPLPAPTDFVRAVVYPLLDRGRRAMGDAVLGRSLRDFVGHVIAATGEQPTVAFDHGEDRCLFIDAWNGLDEPLPRTEPRVGWFDLNELGLHYQMGREAHFSAEPAARQRRHHALVDAYAARWGYLRAFRSPGPKAPPEAKPCYERTRAPSPTKKTDDEQLDRSASIVATQRLLMHDRGASRKG